MHTFTVLFLLKTLTELLRLEAACRAQGISTQIEPVPPSQRAGCMMCLACAESDAAWVREQLDVWGYHYACIPREHRV